MQEKIYVVKFELDPEELQVMKNALKVYKIASKLLKNAQHLELCEYLKFKITDYKTGKF